MKWIKSSYSTAQGNCVEVAPLRDGIAVRDSKDKTGPVLKFRTDDWSAFTAGVKAGGFDLPSS
jgi:hypothetical protein